MAYEATLNNQRYCSVAVSGPASLGQRTARTIVSLLVREPLSTVEELLSRQPVLRDVACLPADKIVRHDVLITRVLLGLLTYQLNTLVR